MLNGLTKYLESDKEKQALIDDLINPKVVFYEKALKSKMHYSEASYDLCEMDTPARLLSLTKFCPKCQRRYPEEENACYDCLVTLKHVSDKVPVHDIESRPTFEFGGKNSYDDFQGILTEENIAKINEFDFKSADFKHIINNIKRTSLENLDGLIEKNYVDMDDLTTLESVLLFAKTFVNVDYKSYGQELGYFEFGTITIDDRQSDSFQITTLIHELAHFLLKEILVGVLCDLLDCKSSSLVDVIVTYILSYSNFTRLIDEYSAHCCEGRFTVYGYQDYSSFLQIIAQMDGEMSKEEIEITKSIGNTFANSIKDILEIFIDHELLRQIKREFLMYHHEKPNYEMLKHENCEKLTEEGFLKAIWLVVSEGFIVASENMDKLEEYLKEVKQ